jgi:hypothetical protein
MSKRLERLGMTAIVCLALAACGHKTPEASNLASQANIHSASSPAPKAGADENAWGNYLVAQGSALHPDKGMRQIYVIPAGSGDAAIAHRKEQLQAISGGLGTVLTPGTLLILGGPDSQATIAFAIDLAKDSKPSALKDITVLLVTSSDQHEAVEHSLEPTGAKVEFITL